MAGSKVSDYAIGDSNIESVMLTLDKAYKGFHQVSLTNYDSTSESQIAAGSVVENNGALYKFDSNESITGSPSDGTVYIRLVPSGDTITAEYTNIAPTWSDSKQGWYGTGADANKRYIEFLLTKNSSDWKFKESLNIKSNNRLNASADVLKVSQNITSLGVHTIQFDTKNKLYNCILGVDYKLQITEPGLYAISSSNSGSSGTIPVANHFWFVRTDSSNVPGSTSWLDIYQGSLLTHVLKGIFKFNENDKVWIEFNINGSGTVNYTISNHYLVINKIGE